MRTTLDIDEQLLEDARRATGEKSKTAVIELGLQALIEKAARKRLAALGGAFPRARAAPRRRSSRE